jgi:hypothetical protein
MAIITPKFGRDRLRMEKSAPFPEHAVLTRRESSSGFTDKSRGMFRFFISREMKESADNVPAT